jgi:hypothetical protein
VKAVEYQAGLKIIKGNPICAECGGGMSLFWGGAWKIESYVIGCVTNREHKGIARPAKMSNYDLPGYNMPGVNRRREKELTMKIGDEKTKALVRAAGGNVMATLTENAAKSMAAILYPEAIKSESGKNAIAKLALICRDYGLNPAMDHVFLIKYDHYDGKGENRRKTGEDWVVVRGIKASRLISGRDKCYGYIDDTPRIMTEDEQKRIFGEVDTLNLVTICKLKDRDGNLFTGYGKYPFASTPKGMDKGNTKFNMSAIRAERQALDKLNPGAMPAIDVVDETYMTPNKVVVPEVGKVDKETGEITEEPPATEGEFTEASEPGVAVEGKVAVEPLTIHNAYKTDPTTITNLGGLWQALIKDFPEAIADTADCLRLSGFTKASDIRSFGQVYTDVAQKIAQL